MSYQENRTVAYLLSALLGAAIYTYFAIQQYQAGSFASTTISSYWGRLVLIIIGVQVGISIVMAVLFSVFQAVATREDEPDLADERDQLITLKADRISYAVFGIGFLLAMGTLAAGFPPLVMFNLIVFSLFGAGIVGFVTQLVLYRRGF